MAKVFLSLGSNQGDRSANLAEAIRLLRTEVTVAAVSPVYETEPVGYLDQPWFLNLVCEIVTDKTPRQMLTLAGKVEQALGRVREIRYGPRTVDVDILLYDDLVLDEPDLQIPHPRMIERAFVLIPLAEIAGDFIHPGTKTSISTLKDMMTDKSQVRLWKGDRHV